MADNITVSGGDSLNPSVVPIGYKTPSAKTSPWGDNPFAWHSGSYTHMNETSFVDFLGTRLRSLGNVFHLPVDMVRAQFPSGVLDPVNGMNNPRDVWAAHIQNAEEIRHEPVMSIKGTP